MKKLYIIAGMSAVGALLLGLAAGRLLPRSYDHGAVGATSTPGGSMAQLWTCAMHPQIQTSKPGKCPICGMTLVPVRTGGSGSVLGPRQVELSPDAARLAGVQVEPVERRFPTVQIRMVGKVEYDETRLAYITARVPGRLDRLYVDYTGVAVKQGDHLVHLYSPELLAAQQELIQAKEMVKAIGDSQLSLIRERAVVTVQSAREKLRLWGLTAEQIRAIEQSAQPSDHLTIHAPVSGIVVQKEAVEGMYVTTGSRVYTIADLSRVWVKLDAYESDLAWLHYGQEAEFQTEAYPGETFKGRVAFIEPVLNPKTRTVKVRVNVENKDGRLKPEMFVSAVVRSRVAEGGRVMDPSFAGKWVSPMHPEIVKDAPGICDVCGMALVSAESLGYVPATTTNAPLTIPATAPLLTGTRAVVYVAVTNRPGLYEGREISLGPRAGDFYIVKDGLREGELVVVSGNFKIDSAVQILAKPSMMNPKGGGPAPGHQHGAPAPAGQHEGHSMPGAAAPLPSPEVPGAFRSQIDALAREYLALQKALAADRDGKAEAARALTAFLQVDMPQLDSPAAHERWMNLLPGLKDALERVAGATDMAARRKAFAPLSERVIELEKTFGPASELHVMHCPMAMDGKGASWLQDSAELRNPYYGSKMLSCGDVTARISRAASATPTPK